MKYGMWPPWLCSFFFSHFSIPRYKFMWLEGATDTNTDVVNGCALDNMFIDKPNNRSPTLMAVLLGKNSIVCNWRQQRAFRMRLNGGKPYHRIFLLLSSVKWNECRKSQVMFGYWNWMCFCRGNYHLPIRLRARHVVDVSSIYTVLTVWKLLKYTIEYFAEIWNQETCFFVICGVV